MEQVRRDIIVFRNVTWSREIEFGAEGNPRVYRTDPAGISKGVAYRVYSRWYCRHCGRELTVKISRSKDGTARCCKRTTHFLGDDDILCERKTMLHLIVREIEKRRLFEE